MAGLGGVDLGKISAKSPQEYWAGYLSKRRYIAYTCNVELVSSVKLKQYLNSEQYQRSIESIENSFLAKYQEYVGGAGGAAVGGLLAMLGANPIAGAVTASILSRLFSETARKGQLRIELTELLMSFYSEVFQGTKLYLTLAASNSKQQAIQCAASKCKQFSKNFICESSLADNKSLSELAAYLATLSNYPYHRNFWGFWERPLYDYLGIPPIVRQASPQSRYESIFLSSLKQNIYIPHDYGAEDREMVKDVLSGDFEKELRRLLELNAQEFLSLYRQRNIVFY